MTSSNGNIFRVTGPLWGNPPVIGSFPSQRSAMRGFDVSFDLCLSKRLSRQWRRRWFEAPSRSLWRQCDAFPWIKLQHGCVLFFTDKACSNLCHTRIQWGVVITQSIFSKVLTKDTPVAHPSGLGMGCLLEFKVWFISCCCHYTAVCNIITTL